MDLGIPEEDLTDLKHQTEKFLLKNFTGVGGQQTQTKYYFLYQSKIQYM